MKEIAPGIVSLAVAGFANVYFVGEPAGGPWTLIDAGITGGFDQILGAAKERFGRDVPPEAILLTHGHPDHSGAALALATFWDVPIYVHKLEMPYVTGRSSYPPFDPTVGGAVAFLTRFFSADGPDLSERVQPFPEALPGLPAGWSIAETPGHSPGHVSFFRESDRTLIAGDAFLTIDLDRLVDLVARRPRLARPPSAMTFDWIAARRSLYRLAALRPETVASGHGTPMSGTDMPDRLQEFAEDFIPPLEGRYVAEPAITDENGIVFLPPPAPDPLPRQAVALSIGVAAVFGAISYARHRSGKSRKDA